MNANSEQLERELASISIVLIDGNRLFREGLATLLQAQADLKLLVTCGDGGNAIQAVRLANPDVLLMDVGPNATDTVRFTAAVRAEMPATRMILMGLRPHGEDIASYVRAGASGFIMKDASREEYVATIRAVAAGAEALPAPLAKSLFMEIVRHHGGERRASAASEDRLTVREHDVADLLADGLSNKEIAKRMRIAVHTVKSHVHSILEKLGLQSRLEVAAFRRGTGSP